MSKEKTVKATWTKPSDGPASNKEAIREALERLQGWFGKKLNMEQGTEYALALKAWPVEALEEIAGEIIEATAPTPGRFPTINQLQDRYYFWRAGHPGKRASYPKTDCRVCRSPDGFLHAAHILEGITYRVVARCSACTNWREYCPECSIIPRLSPEALEAGGYYLEYRPRARPLEEEPPPPIEILADLPNHEGAP
jgi:hypothetical protein